jgi:ATP-binding cassette, subfamily B, bacterial
MDRGRIAALRTALGMVLLAGGAALLDRAGVHLPAPLLILAGLALLVTGAGAHAWRRPAIRRLRRSLALLWPFLRAEWPKVALSLAAVLASSGVALARPWPLKFLVDDVLHVSAQGVAPSASTTTIAAIAAAVVGFATLQGMLGYAETFFLAAAGQRIAFRVRSALFAHLHRLPLAFHERQRTGDLTTRVTSDVTRVQELIMDDLLVTALTRIVQVWGMLVVMLVIDWRVGLVAAITAPLTLLTSVYFRRRIRARAGQMRQREGDIASMAQETISSIRVVKAFGRPEHESRRFDRSSGDMMEAGIAVARLQAGFGWTMGIASALGLAAVIVFGTHRVLAGALTAGTLIVFIQYMRDLQSPLAGLSRLTAKVARASVYADRVIEVLEEPLGAGDVRGSHRAARFAGHVRFDDVTFSYQPGRPALRNVTLELEPGQVVAVVGPSGAGKSTMASLLLRLYDPDEGSVLVDGRDARDYTLDSYLAQTSVVLQESLLFRTTIAENIAYGRPGASRSEIEEAARVAYADEFIRALPNRYDTVIGERGATLSGGQRQRIAIARAVVRDAPILVLDEPATGLDAEAEAIVLDALERLMEGRTTLLIAHKLSTVRRAARIAVIEGGRIVEQDARAALLAAGGRFAGLVAAQADDRGSRAANGGREAARPTRMSRAEQGV